MYNYYKNIKIGSIMLLIIFIISTNNLLGATFYHIETDWVNSRKSIYNIGEARLEGYTKSIIYRTVKDRSYTYVTAAGNSEMKGTIYHSINKSAITEFYFTLTNLGSSGIDIDFVHSWHDFRKGKNAVEVPLLNNRFGYSRLEYNGGLNALLRSRLQISIPAGIEDGIYTVGQFRNYAKNSSTSIERTVQYRVQVITIPNFTVVESDIDFGRIPIDATAAQEAFGRIEFKINNEPNKLASFSATYPSIVNMTNSSDSSTVPLNIELLNGSETGPILGTNFSLSSDTDIYVKATLPPSSITNKSTGIYSGSLTISIDYN